MNQAAHPGVTRANLGVNIEVNVKVNVKVNVDEHEKRNDQSSAQRACPGSAGTVSRKPSPTLVSGSLWACERSRVELATWSRLTLSRWSWGNHLGLER
jgi:hypothetical protein